jgi:hypothetical protein
MVAVLASIAEDPKEPASERRKAAMDVIAVGGGKPPLVQEIAGRDGQPAGALVNINLPARPLTPAEAYDAMCPAMTLKFLAHGPLILSSQRRNAVSFSSEYLLSCSPTVFMQLSRILIARSRFNC